MTNNSVTDFSFLIKECEELVEIVFEVKAILNVLLLAQQYSKDQSSKDLYRCLSIIERLLDNLEKGTGTFLEFIKGMWNHHLLEASS